MDEAEARALIGRRVYHRAPRSGRRNRPIGRWGIIETWTPHIEALMRDPTAAHFTFAIAYDTDVDGPADALIDDFDLGCEAVIEPGPEEVAALDAEWRTGQAQERIGHGRKRR